MLPQVILATDIEQNLNRPNLLLDLDIKSQNLDLNNGKRNGEIVESRKTSDSTRKFLARNEFMYADNSRYLLDGSTPYVENSIHVIPTIMLGASAVTFFTLQHIYQSTTIWEETGEFRIIEDGQYALYADKAGHFFGTYYTAYFVTEAMMMTGFNWEWSQWIGGLTGLTYTTYIEILDGYGLNWGFSPSDFYLDVAGFAFYMAQYYVPFLQNFTPKFTYIPAPWHGDNHRIPSDIFIDDYSSHTLWLSVNVHNLLPEQIKEYWPEWLELSFGYAARNLCVPSTEYECDLSDAKEFYDDNGYPYVVGSPRYIISIDYDLVSLLPNGPGFWNWFKQSLNYIKLPSPAIEFGDVTRFYLVYPFHF